MTAAPRASTGLNGPSGGPRAGGEGHDANGLRVRIATGLLVLVVATTMSLSWLTMAAIERRARVDAGTVLQARVATIHAIFDQWAATERNMASAVGRSAEVQAAAADLLAVEPTPGHLLGSPATAEIRAIMEPVLDAHDYLGFFVIDRRNMSRASSRDENTGTANLIGANQPERLERIFAGESLLMAPQFSDVPLADSEGQIRFDVPTMFAVAPIPGPDGQAEAAVALQIDVANTLVPMLANSGWGDTGEVLAIDAEGAMLNHSRFGHELVTVGLSRPSTFKAVELRDPGTDLLDPLTPAPIQAVRHNWPLTTMAESVTAHHDGFDTDGYRSYLGRPVLGAWEWSDDLGFGLAVEQGEGEALALSRYARTVIATISAIGLALGLSIAWYQLRVRPRLRRSSQAAVDELTRLRGIVDRSSDGVLIVDGDGRIVQVNASACEVLEAGESELVGRAVDLFLPPPGPGDGTSDLEETLGVDGLAMAEHGRRLVRASRGDRSTFPAEVQRVDIGNDDHPLAVVTVRNLEHDPKAVRLAQTLRDLRRLAANASWAAEDPLGRAGWAPVEVGPVDLRDLVEEVAARAVEKMVGGSADDRCQQPDFEIGDLPTVTGDRGKLRLLFAGLIDNAVRHARPDVPLRVEVRAEWADEPGGRHRILVVDNGEGFDPARSVELFEAFTPPALSRRQPEPGMGLPFCRQVAEGHGGTLTASGIPGQGATFVVELPATARVGGGIDRGDVGGGRDNVGGGRAVGVDRRRVVG